MYLSQVCSTKSIDSGSLSHVQVLELQLATGDTLKVIYHEAFVKETNLSEREFFARELKIIFKDVKTLPNIARNNYLIVGTDPHLWSDFLATCPDNSVTFFLLGNETYDSFKLLYFNDFKSIKRVFLHNSPRKNSIVGFNGTLGSLFDIPNAATKSYFYRTWKNAADFAIRTRRVQLKLKFPYFSFPQGYSNRFVHELTLKGLVKQGELRSLFSIMELINEPISEQICFLGQKGSWYRKQLLKSLSRRERCLICLTDEWGGFKQGASTAYVNLMIDSRASLCPPGNLTNETFRYLEALILGRLPITPPYSFQDHHYGGYWSERDGPYFGKWSFKVLSRWVMSKTQEEIRDIVLAERKRLLKEITNIVDMIDNS